jgi:galactofuranosylgalactofuranosylrhamnosyl-N-acetylglucosaminyl-diphospho-decaprenol beta-1,5/1,6-galactofuranosyltransferase
MFALDANHVLCLQYGSAAVRRRAVLDVLRGPEQLIPDLRTAPATVRTLLAAEGQTLRRREAVPVPLRPSAPVAPKGPAATAGRLLRVLGHQLRRVRIPTVPASPAIALRREQGKWWSLGIADHVFLRSAAGDSGFLLVRDRRRALRHLIGAVRSAITLWWRWPALAERYRAAAPSLSSAATWSSVFDES